MKRNFLGVVGISSLLIAAPLSIASAADMLVKAAPMASAPVYSWTGCYVGGNVGYGSARNDVVDVTVVPSFDTGADTGTGIVGGGQAGCDYQFARSWVVGIQGMFDGASLNGSHLYPPLPSTETLGTNTRWFATLTGRIGYAVMPQALLYFKGGAAWVRNDYSDVDPLAPYSGQASSTRNGWTIGGGVEYAFQPNWSIFVEYNYIGLGNSNTTLTYTSSNPALATPYTYNERNTLQTVLVGLNLRFGLH